MYRMILRIVLIANGLLIAGQVLAYAAKTMLPPVMVKAEKKYHGSPTGAQKRIITKEAISASAATSLSQALEELGGLQLQNISGNANQVLISMRGFGANASSNTLVLINGIPLTNPDLAPPDLNAIPLQEIKLIEITAGSESVLYGDQAVGGVINIITTPHFKNKIKVTCTMGSYHQKQCYAVLNHHYKQLAYTIGALKTATDNYRDHNNYYQNLLHGQFNYPYANGEWHFNYNLANERMFYPGALTATQVAQNRRQANNNTDFFRDWNGFFHLKQIHYFNETWRLTTQLARREMHGDGVLTSPFEQLRQVTFLKPTLKGQLGNTLWINGLEAENDRYDLNSAFGITNESQQKYGLFSIINVPLNNKIMVSAGVRGALQTNQLVTQSTQETVSRAGVATLGATWSVNDELKLYLRRAGSFRFPKADENAATSSGIQSLKTQRGVAYEGGVDLKKSQSSTHFSVYQLNLTDEIAFDPLQTPQQPFGSNRNLDPTVRRGFSLAEQYRLYDPLTLSGQYHYVNARFQSGANSGNQIPLVSENMVQAGIRYAFLSDWAFYYEALFTGRQFAANDDANQAGAIGGHTLYNAHLNYHHQQWTASLYANNIFNKYYYFYTVFVPSNGEFFYPAPGRNVLFTLSYDFL